MIRRLIVNKFKGFNIKTSYAYHTMIVGMFIIVTVSMLSIGYWMFFLLSSPSTESLEIKKGHVNTLTSKVVFDSDNTEWVMFKLDVSYHVDNKEFKCTRISFNGNRITASQAFEFMGIKSGDSVNVYYSRKHSERSALMMPDRKRGYEFLLVSGFGFLMGLFSIYVLKRIQRLAFETKETKENP